MTRRRKRANLKLVKNKEKHMNYEMPPRRNSIECSISQRKELHNFPHSYSLTCEWCNLELCCSHYSSDLCQGHGCRVVFWGQGPFCLWIAHRNTSFIIHRGQLLVSTDGSDPAGSDQWECTWCCQLPHPRNTAWKVSPFHSGLKHYQGRNETPRREGRWKSH